ncbi:hypothetical protein ABH920_002468 [Catenulispora sp. EB89]|uniref:hypothetical protein n=1 Tax=Catenulispora sp. EB89 TaxID=3156257 RepID=UPI003519C6CA
MSNLGDYGSALGAIVALGAAGFTALQARVQHRREDFELARALHTDLTTGLVADARALLGTVTFTDAASPGHDVGDVRRAYFTLLWSFERIEGGRSSMTDRHRRPKDKPDAVDFLDKLINWHVRFWNSDSGFPKIRDWLADELGDPVSDKDSVAAFERLALHFPEPVAQPNPIAAV